MSSSLRLLSVVYILFIWCKCAFDCYGALPAYGICDFPETITTLEGRIIASDGLNCTRLLLAPKGYRINVIVHPGTFLRDSVKMFFYDGGAIRDDYETSEFTSFPYIHSYGNDQKFTSRSNAVVVHLDKCHRAQLNVTYRMFRQEPQRCACLPVVHGRVQCTLKAYFSKGLGDVLDRACEMNCEQGYYTRNNFFGLIKPFKFKCEMDFNKVKDEWEPITAVPKDTFEDENEITCLKPKRVSRYMFTLSIKYSNVSCKGVNLSKIVEKAREHIVKSTSLPHAGECFKTLKDSLFCQVNSLNISCSDVGTESVVKLQVQDNVMLVDNNTIAIQKLNRLIVSMTNASRSLQEYIPQHLVFANTTALVDITTPSPFCAKDEVFGYVSVLGSTGCSNCSRHFHKVHTTHQTCQRCPNGTRRESNENYCVNGTQDYPKPSLVFCEHTCSLGFYFNFNSSLCELCPYGTYQNSTSTLNPKCTNCPDGKSTGFVGAKNVSECINLCPAGQYLKFTTCIDCGVGYYMPNNSNRYFKCKQCPVGMTTLGVGTKNVGGCVEKCSKGKYFNISKGLCTFCPKSTYQDEVHETNTPRCKDCPKYTLTAINGSQSASDCLANCSIGEYLDVRTKNCSQCPSNTYQDLNAHFSFSCKSCGKHKITNKTGSTNFSYCIYNCKKGEFYNITSESCQKCQIEFYQNEVGKDVCLPCKPKSFTLKVGSSECINPCTYGEFLNEMAEECQSCPNGYYQNMTEHRSTNCTLCPLDYYNDKIGRRNCTHCPDNKITVVHGAASSQECIQRCSPGTFLNKTRKNCEECLKGFYQPQDQYRLEYCTKCPFTNLTTLGTGAVRLTQCVGYCASSPCSNGAECIDKDNDFYCSCPKYLEGKTCGVITDEQNSDRMVLSFRFTELVWKEQLSNPESSEFVKLAQEVESNARQEFQNDSNFRTLKVNNFTQGSVICDMEFAYVATDQLSTPADKLLKSINDGKLGNFTADKSSVKILNYTCGQPLGMESGRIPDNAITASSPLYYSPPHKARLNSPDPGWAPTIISGEVYLQVDLGEDVMVTGIGTQGSSYRDGSWLTSYYFNYSLDGLSWSYYKFNSRLYDVFVANNDENTTVRNELEKPVKAQYIRIFEYHVSHNYLSFRIEFYGCPIPDDIQLPTATPQKTTAATTVLLKSDADDGDSNVGLIVGLVLGISFLILLVLGIWWVKRNKGFHALQSGSVANVMELEKKSESDEKSKP